MLNVTLHQLHIDPLEAEPKVRLECALNCDGSACGLSSSPDNVFGPHWHVVIASGTDPEALPWLLGICDLN
jgi:hypothetical protein